MRGERRLACSRRGRRSSKAETLGHDGKALTDLSAEHKTKATEALARRQKTSAVTNALAVDDKPRRKVSISATLPTIDVGSRKGQANVA